MAAAGTAGIDARPIEEADRTAVGTRALHRSGSGENSVQIRVFFLDIGEIVQRFFKNLVFAGLISGTGDIGLIHQIDLLVDHGRSLLSLFNENGRRHIGKQQDHGSVGRVEAVLRFNGANDHTVAERSAEGLGGRIIERRLIGRARLCRR